MGALTDWRTLALISGLGPVLTFIMLSQVHAMILYYSLANNDAGADEYLSLRHRLPTKSREISIDGSRVGCPVSKNVELVS